MSDAARFQADRLEAVAKGMREVAPCSAYAEGKETARREAEQALEAARADAALAWRRVTELQERSTQLVLMHRQQLDAIRTECDAAKRDAVAGWRRADLYEQSYESLRRAAVPQHNLTVALACGVARVQCYTTTSDEGETWWRLEP